MIAYLKGKIKNKGQGYVILAVNNVGYKIFVNEAVFLDAIIDKEEEYYIYSHIREDAFSLYGFYSLSQLQVFELLLGVSGIGPKSALGVLAAGDAGTIKEAIARGDAEVFTRVSGIGKKTAERLILELRDKISAEDISGLPGEGSSLANADEIDALLSLGYSLAQARDAMRKVDPSIKDSGTRVKEALKGIS